MRIWYKQLDGTAKSLVISHIVLALALYLGRLYVSTADQHGFSQALGHGLLSAVVGFIGLFFFVASIDYARIPVGSSLPLITMLFAWGTAILAPLPPSPQVRFFYAHQHALETVIQHVRRDPRIANTERFCTSAPSGYAYLLQEDPCIDWITEYEHSTFYIRVRVHHWDRSFAYSPAWAEQPMLNQSACGPDTAYIALTTDWVICNDSHLQLPMF